MKLIQFYHEKRIRPGILKGDMIFPFHAVGDMIDVISECTWDRYERGAPIPLNGSSLAPPVTRPSKIMALGLNYRDHAKESKGKIPKTPLIFAKFPNSLTAHGKPITWGITVSEKVDFEAELAVIIGKAVYRIPEEDAIKAVFGYTCANDVSARDLQFGDGQWVRGKSLDTFCPLGPWIVTPDELPEPHSLSIRCLVNGRVMQDSNTGQMIFGIPEVISFLSRHFTLNPGDIILTGTPHGVGAFRDPPFYLSDGDEVVVEIESIGQLANPCSVTED
ncbi:MAG: fumarylacetoacetate hydrolase family protein [Deltaproteobacteria bacterium]|nr:fumarylacetoacetate hydrolase family protein [Deltaproteobacteria bacterium]MCF8119900.1 fumarylacetoacetate hydrolase family protein [Deltaproteobacteria bacterium]